MGHSARRMRATLVTATVFGVAVLGLGPATAQETGPCATAAHARRPVLAGPTDIVAGPDGNLWFTEWGDRIGRITPAGRVTEFSRGISRGSAPEGIADGPDGNLWYTE